MHAWDCIEIDNVRRIGIFNPSKNKNDIEMTDNRKRHKNSRERKTFSHFDFHATIHAHKWRKRIVAKINRIPNRISIGFDEVMTYRKRGRRIQGNCMRCANRFGRW